MTAFTVTIDCFYFYSENSFILEQIDLELKKYRLTFVSIILTLIAEVLFHLSIALNVIKADKKTLTEILSILHLY